MSQRTRLPALRGVAERNQIVLQNVRLLTHVLRRRLSSRELASADRDDLRQEALIAMLRGAELYDASRGNLAQHLARYVCNGIATGRRRLRGHVPTLSLTVDVIDAHAEDQPDAVADRLRDRLDAVLVKMAARLRLVLLARMQGRRMASIAADLHVSKQRVSRICQEAMAEARKLAGAD